MSLLELKLTILEDYCKKNKRRWNSEYIREHWKLDLDKIKGIKPAPRYTRDFKNITL